MSDRGPRGVRSFLTKNLLFKIVQQSCDIADLAALLARGRNYKGLKMSKYLKPEQQKSGISKHRHCVVCATPVPMEKEFCGPNCEDQFKRAERKKKYTFILILLMFPVLFLILTLLRPK